MKPVFKINGVDFLKWLEREGLSSTDNDLDADGSGRNLLDGLMYRTRIGTKEKWTATFIDLPSSVMSNLLKALYSSGNYVRLTAIDAMTGREMTKTYYFSSITKGAQVYRNNDIYYKGCTFNVTER